jgi:hypothetical protein
VQSTDFHLTTRLYIPEDRIPDSFGSGESPALGSCEQ